MMASAKRADLACKMSSTSPPAESRSSAAALTPARGSPSSGRRATDENRITDESFREKLGLPPCKSLRKTLDEFVVSFNDCDLRGQVSSKQPPSMMVLSALSYSKQELRKCGVFDNSAPHGYGGGLPDMGEDQVRQPPSPPQHEPER